MARLKQTARIFLRAVCLDSINNKFVDWLW
jgi:hypothetical protein